MTSQREATGIFEYAVQEGCGEHWISHNFCPFVDILVGGEDKGRALIKLGDQGKESIGLFFGNRGIADLVDDDNLVKVGFNFSEKYHRL